MRRRRHNVPSADSATPVFVGRAHHSSSLTRGKTHLRLASDLDPVTLQLLGRLPTGLDRSLINLVSRINYCSKVMLRAVLRLFLCPG
jgi:hypothetical protein